MLTNRERVTRGLELLTEGLYPFVERQLRAFYKDDWLRAARRSYREDRSRILPKGDVVRWDAHTLLTVMWDHWNSVFKQKLGPLERSLVCEIRDFRNRWAHQQDFDFCDTFRVLDSIERLLR
ncbi:MAG TPA: AAA+ family ATPase, partial [Planctomycetaceae bacterium]|nr:AAA+ family ATPase [Planctomycetaceae bacterium]